MTKFISSTNHFNDGQPKPNPAHSFTTLNSDSFYLARPACVGTPNGSIFCRCYFHLLFNCPHGDQLSQNVLDHSSPNSQDGAHMGGRDQSDLLFTIGQQTLL